MAYDHDQALVLLFGGTWEWNGHIWSQRTARDPRLRVDNRHFVSLPQEQDLKAVHTPGSRDALFRPAGR